MSTELVAFTGKLDKIINESISSIPMHSWNEDHITYTMLASLNTALSSIVLNGYDFRRRIDWEAYKLRGTYEQYFGDIAILVSINYKDGTNLEGVTFLEAKKRDWRKTTFSAMKTDQCKRILDHAPRAHYLLYDYEDITGFANAVSFGYEANRFRNYITSTLAEKTNSLCVPLNIAQVTGFKDTLLYRHGTPLSWMLSNRFFVGLDLEFDKTALEVATGFLRKFDLPRYVMKVVVTEEGAESMDDSLKPNPDAFQILSQI